MMKTLGKHLSCMLIDMTDLILKETDLQRMKQLRKNHRQLSKQLQLLIDKTVPNDTANYRRAMMALSEANEEIRQAKKNLDRVETVIQKSAKAVDVVAKVLKTVF